jgi:hypothetical protein
VDGAAPTIGFATMARKLPRREDRVSERISLYRSQPPIGTLRVVNLGTRIEVKARFDQRWARGFEIAEIVAEGDTARYRVRRRSDGSVLPALFDDDDVREEKKGSRMWWV